MKKILLSIGVVLASITSFAQVDTLTSHFVGAPTLYYADAALPADSGYISGNNAYGDIAKMQLFDATYGAPASGTISKVLLGVGVKLDGGGSYQVAIWPDNNGQPLNPLTPIGITTISIASTDTSLSAFSITDGTRFYNVIASFLNPVAIPANGKFWAGVVLPTGATNSIALFSNNMSTNPFNAAVTHSGEFWSNGTFHTMGDVNNWSAPIAFAIYPIVSSTVSIAENVVSASVYPNPAKDVLNIQTTEELASVVITTTDGKVVATGESNTISVSSLNAGMYIYKVTTISGKIGTGNFIKN